jgi:hypothetical protein
MTAVPPIPDDLDRLPKAASPAERVLLVVSALAVAALCVVLARLEPDPRGHGTHEQLGLASCSWPSERGMPCPTCGVTTAAVLLLRLRPADAFLTQPFGALVALIALAFVWLGLRHAWRGESLSARVARWPLGRLLLGFIAALLLGWWYRIEVSP